MFFKSFAFDFCTISKKKLFFHFEPKPMLRCYCSSLHCCFDHGDLMINKLSNNKTQQMIFLRFFFGWWCLKNYSSLRTAFNWFFIGESCCVSGVEWEELLLWTLENSLGHRHNERAENDKWIGKLYFYYMKNHLLCAINARSELEKLK